MSVEQNNPEHLKVVNEEMAKMMANQGPGQQGNPHGFNMNTKMNPNVMQHYQNQFTTLDPKTKELLGKMAH